MQNIAEYKEGGTPYLLTKTTSSYEGMSMSETGTHKTVTETYTYDDYGNVTQYKEAGDDTVIAYIQYTAYTDPWIMGKPTLIQVTDGSSQYRRRTGTYDGKGNLRQITSSIDGSSAAVTSIEYDGYGNIQSVTGAANARSQRYSLTYTYDTTLHACITSITDSFGYTSTAQYNYVYQKPTYTRDIDGNAMSYRYDEFGRTTAIYGPYDIGSNVPTISMMYDLTVPAHAVTRNKGLYTSTDTVDTVIYVDGFKRVVQTKKESEVNGTQGMTVSGKIIWDAMGREIEQGQPYFSTSGYSYVNASPVNSTYTSYDGLGRKTQVTYPDTTATRYSYGVDDSGYITTVIDQNGHKKQTYKDTRGNITQVTEYQSGDPIATRYAYNVMGEILTVTDSKGNITRCTYDQMGRRTSIDNPDAGVTEYVYDPAGNVIRKVTPNLRMLGKSIQYTYTYNRLDKIQYPNMNSVYYTYGTSGASYNRAGRIATVDNGDVKEERYYGRMGEVVQSSKTIQITQPGVTTKTYVTRYTFDSMGRMHTLVYPDGEVLTYTYDGGGMLKTATGYRDGETFTYVQHIYYDEFGSRTRMELGNGAVTTYEYNTQNRRLTHIKTTIGGVTYQDMAYTYDAVGNILSTTNTDFITANTDKKTSTQQYTYDDLDRLTAANGNYSKESWLPYFTSRINNYTDTISYDTIGNITYKKQVNTGTYADTGDTSTFPSTSYELSYVYGGTRPHAVTQTGSTTYTYDSNGNMTMRLNSTTGALLNLVYNDENRLTETSDNTSLTTYRYDESGQRIAKTSQTNGETIYVNSNYSVKNNSIESTHIFAGNSRVATKMKVTTTGTTSTTPKELGIFYMHADHLGSSSTVTTKAGAFSEHNEYFPHGEVWISESVGDITLPFKFTGKELDEETGLYYYGARYMDPRLGIFFAVDPPMVSGDYFPVPPVDDKAKKKNEQLPGMGGVFNSVNLCVYNYSRNNPLRFTDPDGNENIPVNDYQVNLLTSMMNAFAGGGSDAANSNIAPVAEALKNSPMSPSWYGISVGAFVGAGKEVGVTKNLKVQMSAKVKANSNGDIDLTLTIGPKVGERKAGVDIKLVLTKDGKIKPSTEGSFGTGISKKDIDFMAKDFQSGFENMELSTSVGQGAGITVKFKPSVLYKNFQNALNKKGN